MNIEMRVAPMRKIMWAVAVLLVVRGEAIGQCPGGCGHRQATPSCTACRDSVLCPETTWLSFQRSNCKQPCFGRSRGLDCGPQIFPPLPYSPQANGYMPGPEMSPWGAPQMTARR